MACALRLERAQGNTYMQRENLTDSKLEQMTEAETLDKDTNQSRNRGNDGETSRSQASKSEFHLTNKENA